MAENLVNYDVMEDAASSYSAQAAALDDVISRLINTNSELQSGFKNQTGDAFINRFEKDYKLKLQTIRDDIQDISRFLLQYVEHRREEDIRTSSNI